MDSAAVCLLTPLVPLGRKEAPSAGVGVCFFAVAERESVEDDGVSIWAVQGILLAAHTLRLQLKDNIKDEDAGAG